MLTSLSLRSLINVRIALALMIVIVLGGIMSVFQARQSLEREINASFNLAVQLIESAAVENTLPASEWQHVFTALQHSRHIDITLVNQAGHEKNLLKVDDDKPTQSAPNWFSHFVKLPPLSTYYVLLGENGLPQSIRVNADATDEINEAWGESKTYFFSIVLMVLLIYVMINFVFHSVFKAVATILNGLREVESGEYHHTLPRFNLSEFDAIASEINNLSKVLADARERNQALARHTMHIQEKERQTMSRELHDEMGQSLTAIKAMSVALKQNTKELDSVTDSIIQICNHLSGVVRSMMRTLHPLSLSELGLGATLNDLVTEWQRRHPSIRIELDYDERIDTIPEDTSIHIYRIVQECLTNVVKHSEALLAEISLQRTKIGVIIKIKDHGIGGKDEGNGFGIRSMRERVESLKGNFDFSSIPGKGVTVNVMIPHK